MDLSKLASAEPFRKRMFRVVNWSFVGTPALNHHALPRLSNDAFRVKPVCHWHMSHWHIRWLHDHLADRCRAAGVSAARKGDHERVSLLSYIAANPESGVSLGGGLRKVRIPREFGGKSGGYRTIYVMGGRHLPIFLVTVFAKNEKDNLTRSEQAAAVELSEKLIATYGDQ